VTYLDGHITNSGSGIVIGITVQVLFRDAAHEVAQNETQALRIIRTRDRMWTSSASPRLRSSLALPTTSAGVRYCRGPMGRRLPDIRIIRVNTK